MGCQGLIACMVVGQQRGLGKLTECTRTCTPPTCHEASTQLFHFCTASPCTLLTDSPPPVHVMPKGFFCMQMVSIEDLASASAALKMQRKVQTGQVAGEAAPTRRLKQWSLGKLMAADPQAAFEMLELLTPEVPNFCLHATLQT